MPRFVSLALLLLFAPPAWTDQEVPAHPHIQFETNEGTIVIELDGRKAPLTVRHFLGLVDSGYFDGTVFHRVIPGFMIQGGGYDRNLKSVESDASVPNESGNGLTNMRGTIAMARTDDPHSANAQFFINLAENYALNPSPDRWGFTVFGNVIRGMDVVDKIAEVRTGPGGQFSKDVPVYPIIIEKASRVVYDD